MRNYLVYLLLILSVVLFSCKKEHGPANPNPPLPPVQPEQKILLKDITIPNLPSPYYHFEYGADSLVTKASFASGFNMYDVFYSGGKISEMRNNIMVNHDTLRYIYNNTGKVIAINFTSETGIFYRRALLNYNAEKLVDISWEHKTGNAGFIADRTVSLTYHADGNLKQMTDHRHAISGQPEINLITNFDNYDDKINVDDFMLIHEGIHDHVFLLPPGVRLQKNNYRKEIRTGSGANYTVDYTYTYNNNKTPISRTGDLLFTTGGQTGLRFTVNTAFTYY
jgi:hypothetical protein